MSKKKKFLIGVAVVILAAGVSVAASTSANAAQAAPDTGGLSQRIIV
jgi:hypothetical protein